MRELGAVKLVEKKSRFYSHLYEINDAQEIQDILKIHRKQYRKANHHCWAIRLQQGQGLHEEFKNDGEVGHPGKVLLELLEKHDLDQIGRAHV